MSAEILLKASELADAIAECDELVAVRNAELAMNSDPEALKLIGEFQKKQQLVYNAQMSGNELSDEDKKDIQEIEGKMNDNPAIKAYMEASDKFEHLLKSVNTVIARAISGDEGCGCGSDCGPECGPECGSSCGCN
ncbi:MAG: YlbF family regulator [Eubacteriales bacterium]